MTNINSVLTRFIIAIFAGVIVGAGIFVLTFQICIYISPPYILVDIGYGQFEKQNVMAIGQALLSLIISIISGIIITILTYKKLKDRKSH